MRTPEPLPLLGDPEPTPLELRQAYREMHEAMLESEEGKQD
jgi:hypothetical protein